MADYGKAFEAKFKEDFLKIPSATIDRLYDPVGGLHGIRNICDFIGYKYPNIVYAECKTVKGNTFPLTNLTQYEKLLTKVDIPGAIVGVFLWFYEHEDSVLFVPITTFRKLKEDGKKSYSIKMVGGNEYPSIKIPSVKKRTFYDSDYSVIFSEKVVDK